jgi:hypothetical protein
MAYLLVPAAVGITAGLGVSAYNMYRGYQLAQSLSSKPTINFQTGHYGPRLEANGVNVNTAQNAVQTAVDDIAGSMEVGVLEKGTLEVDGKVVQWNAYKLPNGTVNVGTIYVVE